MAFAAGAVSDIPVRAHQPYGLTWCGRLLWYSDRATDQITAVDPATGTVVRQVHCPQVRAGLTTCDGLLIQVAGNPPMLRTVDPDTGEVVAEAANTRYDSTLSGLEATRDGVWLGYEDLSLIDRCTADGYKQIESVPVLRPVTGVTVAGTHLLYSSARDSTINIVDPAAKQETASYRVAGKPAGITWDGDRLWYCDTDTLHLRAIDLPGIA